MSNATAAVPSLAAQHQFAGHRIEMRSPLDQLGDTFRRFPDDHGNHLRVAQLAAGGQRIGLMRLETVARIQDARDSPLGVAAGRFAQLFFGDDQHGQLRVHRDRGSQTR